MHDADFNNSVLCTQYLKMIRLDMRFTALIPKR